MRPSNIDRVVNAINIKEDGEQVGRLQYIDYIRHKSNNIDHEFISIIRPFQDRGETDLDFLFPHGGRP